MEIKYLLTADDRKLIQDFNRNISFLKMQALNKKRTLIKFSELKELTGWDKQKVRRKRDSGTIDFEKKDNSIFYVLESIPKEFLINKAIESTSE